MSFTAADHGFMARALVLARRGLFTTTPNPRVGCVLARDGVILGEGWHERAGEAHAEVRALAAAGPKAAGATAYVTLEPCCHQGRTPPCSEALIGAGVRRVVAAMRDPNPLVGGEGLSRLAQAGVFVECGLLEAQARELNIGFVARMTRGRPWLRLKVAASLDGRTALANGQSQWITGPEARRDGHRWRARACAIITGAGTVRDDDPSLTVREVSTPRQPLRVIVDSRLETRPTARALIGGNTLVVCAEPDAERAAALRHAGAEVLSLSGSDGKVDLRALMIELARRGCNEIHGEAGAGLSGAMIAAGLADEVLAYFAPTLLGATARGMFELPGLADLTERRDAHMADVRRTGADLRIVFRLSDPDLFV
jgi:diaminohydroxyphosphoribosylaminopyrimidine deaminase/5-amino-6-(5-phosphoribosylamino)uracil reductase